MAINATRNINCKGESVCMCMYKIKEGMVMLFTQNKGEE